jgi:hypothetical protein
MPIVYETTAQMAENGHLFLDVGDLPFDKGTTFVVKLIPQADFDPDVFKRKMQTFIDKCAEGNTTFKGMSKEEIIADLRRQREDMYAQPLSRIRISLDTNIFIFGIRNIDPYSVLILKNLFRFDVCIAAQVEKELRKNVTIAELKEFYSLIDPLPGFEIAYQQVEQAIFQQYQALGMGIGDALIAAFCNVEGIEIFISENRHFLQELPKQTYEIMDSSSFCKRFGLGV